MPGDDQATKKIEKAVDQVEADGDKAVEQAEESAGKSADKVEDVVEQAEAVLLDPNATGEQKQEVLAAIQDMKTQLMGVTDKWLMLEGKVSDLESKAFASSQPTEQGGEPVVDSLDLEDQTQPQQIPVPAEVSPASPSPMQGSFLSRIWQAIW